MRRAKILAPGERTIPRITTVFGASAPPPPTNDGPQPEGAEQSSHDDNEPIVEEEVDAPTVEPETDGATQEMDALGDPSLSEPANDNGTEDELLPANGTGTGTDG